LKHTAKDTSAVYSLTTSEADILGQAEEILMRRWKRLGAVANPKDAGDWIRMKIGHLDHEVFHVVFLDNRHRIIASENMFRGTVDGASLHPREVVKAALFHNAVAVLLAHNHPSGVAEPSAADRSITAELQAALSMVSIRVLDHLIVGETVVSMAARGLM